MAMLQLHPGQYRRRSGGGMNALRGHSNIQGLTDLGLMSHTAPGLSQHAHRDRGGLRHLHQQVPRVQAAAAGADELLAELREVHGELPEGDVGRRRDEGANDWAYAYLPKLDVPAYDVLRVDRTDGTTARSTGYFCQGFNPLLSASPTGARSPRALCPSSNSSSTMDPLAYRDVALLGEITASSITSDPTAPPSRPRCSSCRLDLLRGGGWFARPIPDAVAAMALGRRLEPPV